MKYLLTAARMFAGAVFIFSGFVKAIDPHGSAIKFGEYFEAFGIDFLSSLAFPLAILLSSVEFMTGINLVARVRMKFTSWLLLVFMSFFTILTLILALTNPVSDCGCFGDAVKLTNWQTFWKNIIVIIPAIFIFLNRKNFTGITRPLSEWVLAGTGLLFAAALSVYCIFHLPIIDFRPYKVGVNIQESMTVPEGAPSDIYDIILVYEKDGVMQEFTPLNFPWNDSLWTWVETKQKLVSKGYEPPIHDFSITSAEGEDVTGTVLANTGYTLLMIAPDLDRSAARLMEKAANIYEHSKELNIDFLCLTSSTGSIINKFMEDNDPSYPIYTMDETAIKTIIRANPGIMLIREGTITGKWNVRDFPDELKADMAGVALRYQSHVRDILSVIALFFGLSLIYVILLRFMKR